MFQAIFAGVFTIDQFLHPLRYWGYEFWSGIGSDIGELSILVGMITTAVATHRFVHKHFQCHADGCKKLGFHHVEGTHYHVCWPHHPVLSLHPEHGVPLAHIHSAHAAAGSQ